MAAPAACRKFETALDAAKKKRGNERWLSKKRREEGKKVKQAKADLKKCKKGNSDDQAIVAAQAMARVASDTGTKFPLKKGWEKSAGAFKKDDAVRKALKVKTTGDAVAKIKATAKKSDLTDALKHATTLVALEKVKKGVTGGFIAAQVAAVAMDVVASIFTLGAYVAAAPAVHASIGAGQAVSLAAVNKDIALNEQKYQAAIQRRAAKAEAKQIEKEQKELAQLEKQAGTSTTAEEKPAWYQSTGAKVGVGIAAALLLFGGVAAARRN